MLTCKITLPDSPHPVIITVVKIPDFRHFILLDGMDSVYFSFNKYKNSFFTFGCWLLPEKLSFCSKNNGFARVRGEGAPP